MKNLLVCLLALLLLCTTCSGCRNSQPETTETTAMTRPTEPAVCDFLDVHWIRTDCNCTESLYFHSNGSCSYSCACGNPVNDDDLCEGYRYDADTQTIYLQFSETTAETVTQILVKSCDGNTLTLDFNGELRTFHRAVEEEEQLDQLTYDGEKYIYLQFPGDIFNYDLKNGVECEEDEVVPIPHHKWNFVYRDGDLFILDSHKNDAVSHFSKDENYTWSVEIDDPETDVPITVPISVTPEDLAYIYSMEGMKRQTTMHFDEIEFFASLVKTDKDQLIRASTSLAYRGGSWYWRSEIIDDSADGWPEYVIKLPNSIAQQISVRK